MERITMIMGAGGSKKAVRHDIDTRPNNGFGGKDIPAIDKCVSRRS